MFNVLTQLLQQITQLDEVLSCGERTLNVKKKKELTEDIAFMALIPLSAILILATKRGQEIKNSPLVDIEK